MSDLNSSHSGIPLSPFYAAAGDETNAPGVYPYTRGKRLPRPGQSWILRELSGEGTASHSNKQFKSLMAKGQQGLDVIGDTPTMAMLDPDHPHAVHAVGTQGVSLCCRADFEDLYRDLPLDELSFSQSLPSVAGIAGLYLVARERGVSSEILRGSAIQLALYEDDCSYSRHLPLKLRMRMATDSVAFAAEKMPKFHALMEDTYFFSETGLDSVEEMALGFVELRYYIRELLKKGVDIDAFAPRIGILLTCRMDLFEEIAKIRATRRIYARMMKEEYGARDPRSMALTITAHTSGLTMTAQQPVNNVARGGMQAVALAMAGVQAMEISTFDEAYRTPSEEAHMVGLRTQQIVQQETNVTRVADPLGGSWYVEELTDQLEKRILAEVNQIEARGDIGELTEQGYFRQIFNNAMERLSRELNDGTLQRVGVNSHQIPNEDDHMLKETSEKKTEPFREQIAKVRHFKQSRDQDKCKQALGALYDVARDEDRNMMEPYVAALAADATIGETAGVLRQACGQRYDPLGNQPSPLDI
jgi:methylmalonyl-CoA mutase, N-terminal domain